MKCNLCDRSVVGKTWETFENTVGQKNIKNQRNNLAESTSSQRVRNFNLNGACDICIVWSFIPKTTNDHTFKKSQTKETVCFTIWVKTQQNK